MDSSPNEIPSCYFPTDSTESSIVIPSYPDTSLLKDTNFTFDDISLVVPPFPPPKQPRRNAPKPPDDMYERRQLDAYRNAGVDLSAKAKRAKQQLREPPTTSQPSHFPRDTLHTEHTSTRISSHVVVKPAKPDTATLPARPPSPARVVRVDDRPSHDIDQKPSSSDSSDSKATSHDGETSVRASAAAGLFEKIRHYRDRLLSSSDSRESQPPPPVIAPLDEQRPASPSISQDADPPSVPPPPVALPTETAQAPRAKASQRKREPSRNIESRPARDIVYNTEQPAPATTAAPLAVTDLMPTTSTVPERKEHPLISALTEEIRRKRSSSDDSERPAKKAKSSSVVSSDKENAPAAGGSTRDGRRPFSASTVGSKKRITLAPLPALTVPVTQSFTTDRVRERTVSKELDLDRAKEKAKPAVVNMPRALTVSDLNVKSRVPSTSFEPALPAVPQLNIPKHKHDFHSTRSAWEKRSASNYHPTPDFASMHARDALRMSKLKSRISLAPVVPQGFDFATSARAKEREEFEKMIREKEAQLAELKEQKRREEEERAAQEVLALRKKLDENVKAKEVPTYIKKRADKLKTGNAKSVSSRP